PVTANFVRPAAARRGGGRGGSAARTGDRLAYVNRLLLEDAFPTEFAKVPQHHIGYPFSNAWVHQTVEAICIALMVDAKGDADILQAQQKMRATLEDWIPKILAAQESDGYLQTRFTCRTDGDSGPVYHWNPATRGEHEGYVAGYFIESAINHYTMTGGQDQRLYDAAKKLADCWVANLGPDKKVWFDGHQEMEQALVRFGRFVNDTEGHGRGDAYVKLAKFLLDSRRGGSEYDQSHLPMIQQYEVVGHAVRAAYTYSGMADVAAETHDTDYQSAVLSLWDNLVNKKYYLTGGIGSGETSEGFGPNYSLRNGAYCESCSTCGLIFFQYKMNLAYHDAKYADLYEESLYNALLGATDLDGKTFFYDNPLVDGRRSAWHSCPCCVGNIPRTLLMIPTWTYVRGDDGLYVNLFIGSTINLEKVSASGGKTDVQMVQKTDYPWSGNVSITVNPKESKTFTVYVRVPNRRTSALYTDTPQVSGLVSLAVNGQKMTPKIDKGYAAISRPWRAGDKIEVVLPMQVQRVTADPKIAADKGLEALRYGPLIYNVERADNAAITNAIGDGPLQAVWRPDLLHGVMAITGQWADGSPLLAIPNYARLNRLTQTAPGSALGGDASVNYAGNTSTNTATNAPASTAQAAPAAG
ncbi:MAG: beta-L-arabinofuranosidase domain-containing protein, partial [Verrucomicrobiota bacterium]